MSNRESYPASLFPMRGDVSAEAGATTIKVIGLNGVPISMVPPVLINGQGISLDYVSLVNTAFVINYDSDDFLGDFVNGVLI